MGFIQREIDRLRIELTDSSHGPHYAELYAVQQALSWATEPDGFRAPFDMVMGTPLKTEDCPSEPHPLNPLATTKRLHFAALDALTAGALKCYVGMSCIVSGTAMSALAPHTVRLTAPPGQTSVRVHMLSALPLYTLDIGIVSPVDAGCGAPSPRFLPAHRRELPYAPPGAIGTVVGAREVRSDATSDSTA